MVLGVGVVVFILSHVCRYGMVGLDSYILWHLTLYIVSPILSDRDDMIRNSFWSCNGSSV